MRCQEVVIVSTPFSSSLRSTGLNRELSFYLKSEATSLSKSSGCFHAESVIEVEWGGGLPTHPLEARQCPTSASVVLAGHVMLNIHTCPAHRQHLNKWTACNIYVYILYTLYISIHMHMYTVYIWICLNILKIKSVTWNTCYIFVIIWIYVFIIV